MERLDKETFQRATQRLAERHESLKVRLKLTNGLGSKKPAFEVVRGASPLLSGSGGFFGLRHVDGELKTEFFQNNPSSQQARSSSGRPGTQIALDRAIVGTPLEEGENTVQEIEQGEGEDRFPGEEDQESNFGDEGEDGEEEEEEEEEEENNRNKEKENRSTVASSVPFSAPASPTPSELLRPHGFLAEQSADDDSCYPRSPPVSPAKMVEMNGSTSTIGGSDNDSGHSRSPAPFPGGSGSGSVAEEDSAAPMSWEEFISEGTNNTASSDNSQSDGSPGGNVNDGAPDLDGGNNDPSGMLDNDPLLLPGGSASVDGEQDNLSLLQELVSPADPPLQSEADRGAMASAGADTEYMSLDRLGEASFCCDVCGDRQQDRRALEDHRAMAGHYKCLITAECGAIVWSTAAELAAHQAAIHSVQQSQASPHALASTSQTSPRTPGAPGTPPMQQLAQQVQRMAVPGPGHPQPTPGYPAGPGGPGTQYPLPPQQQMMPQMGMMPQMMPGQMPQRRPPAGYRGPLPGPGQPPYSQGPVGPQQPGYPGPGGSGGGIQPRPLNTMVAQQPRGAAPPGRMPPVGAMMPAPGRGGVPMSMRGHKRPGPMPGSGRGGKQRRMEGMLPPQQPDNGAKKSDASAVANILATRGITVTPAAGAPGPPLRGAAAQAAAAGQARQRQNMMAPAPPGPAPVTTLNLNSAISIIPTTGGGGGGGGRQQQNNSGFAVPQVRALGRQPVAAMSVDRPPRPPTVDLTGDGPVPPPGSTRLQMGPYRGRGRPSNLARTTCQICDKVFASPDMLQQHMAMHRGPGKLPYRCNLCNAQYPTSQGLQQHRQTYHKEGIGMGAPLAPGEEMVIPLIDLKQPGVAARLSSLGIQHCIPLSGLGNQSNGFFSLPVVSIDGSRPGAAGNLRSLGASGVLSIGPIKLVPK